MLTVSSATQCTSDFSTEQTNRRLNTLVQREKTNSKLIETQQSLLRIHYEINSESDFRAVLWKRQSIPSTTVFLRTTLTKTITLDRPFLAFEIQSSTFGL